MEELNDTINNERFGHMNDTGLTVDELFTFQPNSLLPPCSQESLLTETEEDDHIKNQDNLFCSSKNEVCFDEDEIIQRISELVIVF